MRKPLFTSLFILLSLSLVLTLAGCGPAATTEPTTVPEELSASKTIRFGWVSEPDCLTNIYTCGLIYYFSELLWEGINGLGPNCSPLVPRQAESVDISNDGKTFTFHLYDGITWRSSIGIGLLPNRYQIGIG
jgi:ABC-type transport system substrate-binding protein